MIVLISGASGLIGGRLLEFLSRDETLELRAASRIERRWPATVKGVVVDPLNASSYERACDGAHAVVNLATMGEAASAANPSEALAVNVGGMLQLASAANAAGVQRLLHLSTAKVYGPAREGPITEESPTDPRTDYAITHRAAEDYAMSRHASAVVLRLTNGFGFPVDPAVGWDVIANDMCRQAVKTGEIVIRSSGRSWRDFVALPDIIAAISLALGPLAPGRYNVGSGQPMTLAELAERISGLAESILGRPMRVKTGAPAVGENNPRLNFRIDKLAGAGYQPSGSFEEEIARTLSIAEAEFRAEPRTAA